MWQETAPHQLRLLFVAALYFVLPVFLLCNNKRSAVNRAFFIFGVSAALWQLPFFLTRGSHDYQFNYFLTRIAYVGFSFIMPACFQLVTTFVNLQKRSVTIFFYLVALWFSCLILSGNTIVAGVVARQPITGVVYTLFLAACGIPYIMSFVYAIGVYRAAESPYTKKRIKYLLVVLPVALLSTIDAVPGLKLEIYPLGFVPLMLFGIAITYAATHYRLIDVETIIKKACLIIVGFIFAEGLLYTSILTLQPFFYALAGKHWMLFPIFIALLVGIGLFYFVGYIRRIDEGELSKKFAYRLILKREIGKISSVRNIGELVTYVVRDLTNWVRLGYVSVFILDARTGNFVLAKSLCREPRKVKLIPPEVLTKGVSLVQMLMAKRKPIVRSEMKYYLESGLAGAQTRDYARVIQEMNFLGSEITMPSFCDDRLLAVVNIGNKLAQNEILTTEDLELFDSLSRTIGKTLNDFMVTHEKANLVVTASKTIISAIDSKDGYSRGHTDRVEFYSRLLGKALEAQDETFSYDENSLCCSAQLHDVGKINIPDSILFKPTSLNEHEWSIMKKHPFSGAKIINPVKGWLGDDVCAGISQHHENFDGSGYPFNLKSQAIHIFARIIRVADAFDAMTSNRPYRSALSKKSALEELHHFRGKYFDPGIVDLMDGLYLKGAIGF